MYSREEDLGTNSAPTASKVPMPVSQADEESTFFITDVWGLCERVLQRWMPEIGFNERVPEGKKFIQ